MTMTKSERREVVAMLREVADEGEAEQLSIIAAVIEKLTNDRTMMQDHSHPGCAACYFRLSTIDNDITDYRWIIARGNA